MMAHEFSLLRRILKEQSGLNLGADKEDMLEGKLRPLLKELKLPSISHLMLALIKPDAHLLRLRVAQAVTVQESYFFRDKTPFQYFIDVMLPRLMGSRQASRRIRAWCAAAATGQEPYSLAIELAEHERQLWGWTVEIIASDFAEDGVGESTTRRLQPIRGAEGPAYLSLGQIFQKGRKRLEIDPRYPREGDVPHP